MYARYTASMIYRSSPRKGAKEATTGSESVQSSRNRCEKLIPKQLPRRFAFASGNPSGEVRRYNQQEREKVERVTIRSPFPTADSPKGTGNRGSQRAVRGETNLTCKDF